MNQNEFEDYLLGLPDPEYVLNIRFTLKNVPIIPSLLHLFPNLQYLNLSGNSIVDIIALANLPNSLQKLNLYDNEIVYIGALANLPNSLKKISLCNNEIVDFTPLKNLPESLEEINLEDNPGVDYSPILCQIPYRYKLDIVDDLVYKLSQLQEYMLEKDIKSKFQPLDITDIQ